MYPYPAARDRTYSDVVDTWSDAELYRIIKNGVEYTGMTGMGSTHQDGEIWSASVLVRQLPTVSPAELSGSGRPVCGPAENPEHPRDVLHRASAFLSRRTQPSCPVRH